MMILPASGLPVRRPLRLAAGLLLAVLCLPAPATAVHPEGFSGLHVVITDDAIKVAATVHTRDLGGWFPPRRYPDYVADVTREMEKTVAEIVELRLDDRPLPTAKVSAFLLEVGLIEIDVDYRLPDIDKASELLVWSKHLINMPRGHQQLLFVEDRRGIAATAEQGVMRLEEVLTVELDAAVAMLPPIAGDARKPTLDSPEPVASQADTAQLPADASPAGAEPRPPRAPTVSEGRSTGISFFWFGIEHIITGYDHLLFLAALLLTCTRFHEAATLITCFTIAHSITLALAALDLVRLPGGIVEPAIALSIVYVTVENLLGEPPLWRRAGITCCFGLIHGLGFASALRDIGLGTIPGGVFWPLLKFNLGVEAGQLCVAAVIVPLLLWARKQERLAERLVPVGSLLVASIGGYWLVARVWSQWAAG